MPTFSGYSVVEEIGEGGFAKVYLATSDQTGDAVAIKQFLSEGGAELDKIKAANEATVIEKDKAIAELTSGTRETVQQLQARLTEKQKAVPAATAAVFVATGDFNRTQTSLRAVNARIATLSSILIPNISPVCTFINQVFPPRT